MMVVLLLMLRASVRRASLALVVQWMQRGRSALSRRREGIGSDAHRQRGYR
jgi:hypothetical protein